MRTHGVGEDGHQVVKHPGDLSEESSDPLGSFWHLNVEQLLDGHRVDQLVGHCRSARPGSYSQA